LVNSVEQYLRAANSLVDLVPEFRICTYPIKNQGLPPLREVIFGELQRCGDSTRKLRADGLSPCSAEHPRQMSRINFGGPRDRPDAQATLLDQGRQFRDERSLRS
jgi:hypothetical protein